MRARRLVTLEGYNVEGGYDRAYGPATCYTASIALGHLEGPGSGDDLWRDYESVLDFVGSLGVDGIRLTLEWARIEPTPGHLDEGALVRYEQVVRRARGIGLWVTLALLDGVWPSWCGPEAWILPWVEPKFLAHVARVKERFAGLADAVVGVVDVDALVRGGYVEGTRPPFRRSAQLDAQVARAQLARMNQSVRDVFSDLVVDSHVNVDADPSRLALIDHDAYEEVHLRSLVRGRGPLAARVGLVGRHGGEWRLSAEAALFS